MMNMYTLVGRINYFGEDYLVLSVSRPYKNAEGIYETDKFNIYMSNGIATRTKEYCKLKDLIAVKGTLESVEYQENGKMFRKLKLVADKIQFLAPQGSPAAVAASKGNEGELDEDCD